MKQTGDSAEYSNVSYFAYLITSHYGLVLSSNLLFFTMIVIVIPLAAATLTLYSTSIKLKLKSIANKVHCNQTSCWIM